MLSIVEGCDDFYIPCFLADTSINWNLISLIGLIVFLILYNVSQLGELFNSFYLDFNYEALFNYFILWNNIN